MKMTQNEIIATLKGVDNSANYGDLYERIAASLCGKTLTPERICTTVCGTVRFWLLCHILADDTRVNTVLLPRWLEALTPPILLPAMRAYISRTIPRPN